MLRSVMAVAVLGLAVHSAQAEAVRKANPVSVPKPVAAYSHVAVVPPGTRLLYLAGQVGNRADGTVPATIEEQAVQALENIRLILAAEGAGPEDIVKLTFYAAAKPTDMAKIGAKRAQMLGKSPPPPSTWVYVSGLASPQYLIEVEAIAAVPDKAPFK